jgi:hypothetical protein
VNAASHRAKYQGKQLLSLMLAICLPAALLYIRLVLALAAGSSRATPAQSSALNRCSLAVLLVFFAVQLACARYLQRLFPAAANPVKAALQYLGVLLLCVLFSLTGAILLEAFGWNVFLRTAH